MQAILHKFRPHSVLNDIAPGTTFLFQGEIPTKAMVIQNGVVRAYTITSNGEERTVAFYSIGDVLPIAWLFGDAATSLFYYDTLTKVTLLTMTKESFLQEVMGDTESLKRTVKFLGNQYTGLMLRITGLEQTRAMEKLGFTLYYLLFRHSKEISPGKFKLNLKLSHAVIASLVGNTRETTTGNLKKLRDNGVIEYTRSEYVVDKTKLENFLGEDTFRDLSIT